LRRKLSVKKSSIKPEDIKANIYDTIKLIIDISGVTSSYLNSIQETFKELFLPERYNLKETELYADEVNDLNERESGKMTLASRKRLMEKESVLRFCSKDDNEEVVISRLFVCIKLEYKAAHSLTKKINLMGSIIKCFSNSGYFGIERITLIKINSIVVCISLYRLYQCFSKSMFGDITYTLGRQGKEVTEIFLENESYFIYGENEVTVSKTVQKGIYNDNEKSVVYEGVLNINTCYERVENKDIDVATKIQELNSIIFEIFISHITGAFAEDLVKGDTNKVVGGFNKNE
jgi:hypothetical protein